MASVYSTVVLNSANGNSLGVPAVDSDNESFVVDYSHCLSKRGSDLILPADNLFTTSLNGSIRLRDSLEIDEPPLTVPTFFRESCEQYADQAALCYKENGEWKTVNYSEYACIVKTVAKAFLKLGLEKFHTVCILGSNRPEWFYSYLGAILAGGIASGVYNTNSAESCLHCLQTTSANIVVVENDLQLQKILKFKNEVPTLKAIIQYSGKPRDFNVYSWDDILELGSRGLDNVLDDITNTLATNQCCTVVFTSGTGNFQKAAMLSHDNIIFNAKMCVKYMELEESSERFLSYLPLSHIAAQLIDIYMSLICGGTVYFAEKDLLKGTLVENFCIAKPTVLFGVPQIWEKIKEGLENSEKKSSRMRQYILSGAKSIGLAHYKTIADRHVGEPVLFRTLRNVVFSKVKETIGLDCCKYFLSGAAPVSVEVKEYMSSYDMPISEAYGLTECSGCHCVSKPTDFEFTSCGDTLPGVRTKIIQPNEEGYGEICLYGRHVFMGYVNDEENTRQVIDSDGWLHSGDIGTCDANSFVKVTGRLKELIIMSDGENIPPAAIEMSLKSELPAISNAVVVGDKKDYLSALITLKCQIYLETGIPTDELAPEVKEWCRSLGYPCKTIVEVIQKKPEQIYCAIGKAIDRVNSKATSTKHKIQKFTVLPRDFSIASGELGPTMKVIRQAVHENYKDEISELYK